MMDKAREMRVNKAWKYPDVKAQQKKIPNWHELAYSNSHKNISGKKENKHLFV